MIPIKPKHRFSNIHPNQNKTKLWHFSKWLIKKIFKDKSSWPSHVEVDDSLVPNPYSMKGEIDVSYVGHTTFLIQTENLNILTDPVWSDRASPINFLGPKRVQKPGIKIENLPKIDLILISHNHYDHLDISTLKILNKIHNPLILVPTGNKRIITKHIETARVEELKWQDAFHVDSKNSIHLEPAQHWSSRSLFDRNLSLWGTFIVKTEIGEICFIGDSGYNEYLFKNIGEKYKNILVSLIPIGAWHPREFMQYVHMDPKEAVLTHIDLNSSYSIGSHFDVFPLADDEFGLAEKELTEALKEFGIEDEKFFAPKVGTKYKFEKK